MASASRRTDRDVLYEPNFDGASLKGQELCDRALNIITGSDLIALTKLPRVAYPEIVRAFYEKFKFELDDEGKHKVTVKIDEDWYTFGCKEVAKALKIRYRPMTYTKSEDEMLVDLMKVPKPVKVLRCSHLHEDFWVVDKFLRAFMCPFMHDNELSQYAYKFWHSLLMGNVIDVPAMVIEMMAQSHHGGKNKAFPHGLAFSRTITALLPVIKCKISAGLEVVEEFETFNHKWVKLALSSLKGIAGLKQKKTRPTLREGTSTAQEEGDNDIGDQEMPHATQGDPSGPSYQGSYPQGQPPYEPFRGTQDEFLHGIDARLQGFGTMMEGMYTMVQGYGPTLQEIQSSIHGLDTRVQGVETSVQGLQYQMGGMHANVRGVGEQFEGLQEQMNDITFEQREIYRLQQLSIHRSYSEEEARDMFGEANTYAESEPPRRNRRRKTRANGGNHGA